jgi:hypothetical protein
MKTITLKNSGFGLNRVIETNDKYAWGFENLIAYVGIISFRIIKLTKHD